MKQPIHAGFLLAMLAMGGLASSALAMSVEQRLVVSLKAQGYVILEDGYTWLGRLRIVAENSQYHREIVVNPETGEVLRDYVVMMAEFAPKGSADTGTAAFAFGGGRGDDHDASAAGGKTLVPDLPDTAAGLVAADPDGEEVPTLTGKVAPQTGTGPDHVLLTDPIAPKGPNTP